MNELYEGDVYAQLTELRDGLRADGYDLQIRAINPQVSIAITAGPDACEDCLVGKDLMTRHVLNSLNALEPELTANDIELTYPGEVAA